MGDDQVRYTVHFGGRVQGVGFRYTAMNIARTHEVAGYVQNLPDGRVLLVAEGAPEDVEGFVSQVAHEMKHFIETQEVDQGPATGEYGAPGVDALAVRY